MTRRYRIESLGSTPRHPDPRMVEWLEAVDMAAPSWARRPIPHGDDEDDPVAVRRRARQGEELRPPRPLAPRNLPPGVEGVLNRQDWEELKLTAREMREVEERDMPLMQEAAALKAKGETKPCPVSRYFVDAMAGRNVAAGRPIRVRAEIQVAADHWRRAGSITAYPDANKRYIVSSSDTELSLLADCPGLGTGLYERAAKAACEAGGVLTGSDARSAFSERFWARQVKKGRAECGTGKGYVYDMPLRDLRNQLRTGEVTVPQFNKLVRGLPPPPRSGEWPCGLVPLNDCPAPESLRGLRRRKR